MRQETIFNIFDHSAACAMSSDSSLQCFEEQQAEVDLIAAAYAEDFILLHHPTEASQVQNDPTKRFCFSVTLRGGSSDNHYAAAAMAITIRFTLPADFPAEAVVYEVDAENLPNATITELKQQLLQLQKQDPKDESVRCFDICQHAEEFLRNVKATVAAATVEQSSIERQHKPRSVSIARFLIYFHHIMSTAKRKAIIETAKEYELGGVSKTGFPGVVIVEGALENVLEFVRRIQRLRWQQMVVRGEESETIPLAADGEGCTATAAEECINTHRKFRDGFQELEEGSMSEVASICRSIGLHSLFMTAMKKYEEHQS